MLIEVAEDALNLLPFPSFRHAFAGWHMFFNDVAHGKIVGPSSNNRGISKNKLDKPLVDR
jgi:hypothetical protein